MIYQERTFSIFIDPAKLRRMADEMERKMSRARIGESVWREDFHDKDLTISLVADQDWFQRRADGIPDWEEMKVGPDALARFPLVTNETREFPKTYSGIAWRAAYKIWKGVQTNGDGILSVGPYDDVPGVDLKDLDLSGFMYGWAMNAVRQLLGKAAGPNGAIVTIGGPQARVFEFRLRGRLLLALAYCPHTRIVALWLGSRCFTDGPRRELAPMIGGRADW